MPVKNLVEVNRLTLGRKWFVLQFRSAWTSAEKGIWRDQETMPSFTLTHFAARLDWLRDLRNWAVNPLH